MSAGGSRRTGSTALRAAASLALIGLTLGLCAPLVADRAELDDAAWFDLVYIARAAPWLSGVAEGRGCSLDLRPAATAPAGPCLSPLTQRAPPVG